jgi:aspartyl-tRNA(Asn)/glutamyl-tRNA(Gln) amidotransferase subunit A
MSAATVHEVVATSSISELGRMLRRHEVSAVELALASLQAIEGQQSRINAFITVTDAVALTQAAAVDARLAAGDDLGPLMGIPVAVKDIFETKGIRTTACSSLLADWIPDRDAEVVVRLRQAGAVLVGKANMDEFAYGPHQAAFGRTSNPHDPTRYTGGSSAGSAAAVASGSVVTSIGTDAGGSIRMPAAWCGVVGMKPSFGLVSLEGALRIAWSLEHAGPLAKTVADVRATLAATAARPLAAPTKAGAPTVAIVAGALEHASESVRRAMLEGVARLIAAGAVVREDRVVPGLEHHRAAFMVTLAAEGALALETLLGNGPESVAPRIRATFAVGAGIRATDYLRAQRYRQLLRVRVDAALEQVDALITPAALDLAARWADLPAPVDHRPRYLAPFNLTGHPAITLPAPIAEGLPVGFQLTGARGQDERLLDVAAWVEKAFRED